MDHAKQAAELTAKVVAVRLLARSRVDADADARLIQEAIAAATADLRQQLTQSLARIQIVAEGGTPDGEPLSVAETSVVALRAKLAAAERELCDLKTDHANHFGDVRRTAEWSKGTKPAVLSFTDGPERQLAYLIEAERAKLAAAEKRAEWAELLARFIPVALEGFCDDLRRGASVDGAIRAASERYPWQSKVDANGLPVETPALRAALEAAMAAERKPHA